VSGQWAGSGCGRAVDVDEAGRVDGNAWVEVEGSSEASPGRKAHGDGYGGGR
jgi:hypothetical protein